jgi:hypothetical protein
MAPVCQFLLRCCAQGLIIYQEMDIPPQSVHSSFDDGLLPFPHAIEEVRGELERVSSVVNLIYGRGLTRSARDLGN